MTGDSSRGTRTWRRPMPRSTRILGRAARPCRRRSRSSSRRAPSARRCFSEGALLHPKENVASPALAQEEVPAEEQVLERDRARGLPDAAVVQVNTAALNIIARLALRGRSEEHTSELQ